MDRQAIQWAILHSDWQSGDSVVKDFMAQIISEERLAEWGPPDTSGNVLANVARQLSTGGLYDRPPRVSHPGQGVPGEADDVVSTFLALVDRIGLWRTGQERSRKAIGMGDCLLVVGWDARRKVPTLRFAQPHNVVVRCHRDNPAQPVALAEIGIRQVDGAPVYCWDVYDLDTVSFRVYRADRATEAAPFGMEIPDYARAGIEGEKCYPWLAADGTPRIPWVRYATKDTLSYWHDLDVRDAARGTMFGVTLWTYTHHCARDATGSMVLVTDVVPPAGKVTGAGTRDRTSSVQMNPGAVWFCTSAEGNKQPTVNVIGAAVNLKELRDTALAYEAQQCVRLGVSPSDIQRTGNDPSSGAALAITNQGRREYSRAIVPMFSAADAEAIELLAIACRQWGGLDAPESGYIIAYDIPPESPQAQAERREQQTWAMEQGQASAIDIYLANNPGSKPADAIRELVRIGRERASLAALIADPATDPVEPPPEMTPPPG